MEQSKLDATDLLLFARVAEAGSFSRAAERLKLPKSTLSRRITELENRLGERLLLRTTRKLSLTEFGMHILEHAQQISVEVEAASLLAQSRQVEPSGTLRVSMPGDLANLMLAPMLAHFVGRYPRIDLQIDLTPHRVDLVADNFDLAVRIGELQDDATLVARRVWFYSPGLYASPGYLAKAGTPQTPEDLAGHQTLRVLTRQGNAEAWNLRNGDKSFCSTAIHCTTINSPELLAKLAMADRGIVSAGNLFTALSEDRGELVRVLPEWHLEPVTAWAVYPSRRLLPSRTRVFLDMLEAWMRPGAG
ncbi:MAG: LysR family transcriptional regulator [Formivibrio sp.]|nr:LysR family transcriptional regulator [Formivibrio sp.]